jgi:hypothetical protein
MYKPKPMMDLTNEVYGSWTVLYEAPKASYGQRRWNCRCTCGAKHTVQQTSLRSGTSVQCLACRGLASRSAYTYGHVFFSCATHILSKVSNPNDPNYVYYGARGIEVYKPWEHNPGDICKYLEALWFDQFRHTDYANYGRGPGMYSVDRIDNDGDYRPSNLRFATKSEQNLNQRRSKNNGK